MSEAEPRHLDLTREVMQEREKLEILISRLQSHVKDALSLLDMCEQEERMLELILEQLKLS